MSCNLLAGAFCQFHPLLTPSPSRPPNPRTLPLLTTPRLKHKPPRPPPPAPTSPTELGHHRLRHIPIAFATSQALLLARLLLFGLVRSSDGLFEAVGFYEGRPQLFALLLFSYLSAPLDEVGKHWI